VWAGFWSLELSVSPKIHRYATIVSFASGSVLASENVQLMPVHVMEPIAAIGAELACLRYGVSVTARCKASGTLVGGRDRAGSSPYRCQAITAVGHTTAATGSIRIPDLHHSARCPAWHSR